MSLDAVVLQRGAQGMEVALGTLKKETHKIF